MVMAGLTGAGGCTDLRKEKREQREERGNEKKREKVSDEMRGERNCSVEISEVGIERK